MLNTSRFNPEYLRFESPEIFAIGEKAKSVDELRTSLARLAQNIMFEAYDSYYALTVSSMIRVHDCTELMFRLMTRRSEEKANFSVAQAIMDIAHAKNRPDLTSAFFAEMLYLFQGLHGGGPESSLADLHTIPSSSQGREAAVERSMQLDELSDAVKLKTKKYVSGLESESIKKREKRRQKILEELGNTVEHWFDWRWQVNNVIRDAAPISQMLTLSEEERKAISVTRENRFPFGITPYYLSLMDDESEAVQDRAIRAQVIPPKSYIEKITEAKRFEVCLDFMRESDTSPFDLITRRYPAICIFKPYNTCPQICVYCQRNWEIKDAMEPGAMASEGQIEEAINWIREHPSICEVLITGGDPLSMDDEAIEKIMGKIANIPSVERIRIGTRTLVTLPMRITNDLVDILRRYRKAGKRQIAVVTHVQSPYEITPDMVAAVNRLRKKGIPVYNQLVFTFFVSRRFEAANLRHLLSLIGIDPYYTFNTMGKEETLEYRVPIARLLQEQKEEARLLPGLSRTDESVYNIPGFGKNYLKANNHRELISVLPNGSRLYEFHPWEKNIINITKTYLHKDVPILDYLLRLDAIGENISEYETIWYYY
jgi:lysine 2,3-aminomutase